MAILFLSNSNLLWLSQFICCLFVVHLRATCSCWIQLILIVILYLVRIFVDRHRNARAKDAVANGLLDHRYVLSSPLLHWAVLRVHWAAVHWEQLVWRDRQRLISQLLYLWSVSAIEWQMEISRQSFDINWNRAWRMHIHRHSFFRRRNITIIIIIMMADINA